MKMAYNSLQKNFLLFVLPIITFITILFFLIIQWNNYITDHELLLEKSDLILKTQSYSLQILFWNIDDESISSLLDLIIEDQDIVGVNLFDERDQLYASRGIHLDKNRDEIEEWLKTHIEDKISINNFLKHIIIALKFDKNNFHYYTRSLPLYYDADGVKLDIGTLYIITSDESYHERFSRELLFMISIFILIFLILFFCIMLIYRSVIGIPLTSLKLSINEARSDQGILDSDDNLSKLNEIDFLNSIFSKLWTDQKFLERELIQSKERFETYISEAPIPIIIMNATKQVLNLNKGFTQLYGYTLDDLPSEDTLLYSFFPDDLATRNNIRDSFLSFRSEYYENINKVFEAQILIKDGSLRIVDLKKTQIGDISIISVDDITNRISAEQEKILLLEQLNHRGKMDAVGQLAGGIAHDFNNVLTGIMSAAQLLQLPDRKLDDMSFKYVNMILKASERATDLIKGLLVFSRKENHPVEVLNFHDLLTESVDILSRTIDKKASISLMNNADRIHVIGDHSTLENIFINLGINASHAMSEGGEINFMTKNVYLDQSYCDNSVFDISPGDYLKVAISDTGHGISEEDLKKIFEPFFTTKIQGQGTGLGLAAVYGTVLNHNGEIRVFSEVGIGTTFELFFPCSKDTLTRKEVENQVRSGRGTVLFVDDEDINRSVGKDVLESLGYNVILAENGVQAVSIFKDRSTEIDITILDMIMPEMNGSETFYRMQDIEKNCKIIIASGNIKNENISLLLDNGLSGFINKPYLITEISELLYKNLNNQKS